MTIFKGLFCKLHIILIKNKTFIVARYNLINDDYNIDSTDMVFKFDNKIDNL